FLKHLINRCRSGAWTPPWLDQKFEQFIAALGMSYERVNCPERKWNPEDISLSDQINYLLA
ncbi:MAG: arginase, partial [Bacillota bacterium]